jgi:PAS domain S-box-containing protein
MTEAPVDVERFFTLSLDMLCIAGFDGVFRRLNPAWETTLGYTFKELTACRMFDFVHPDDRERTLAQNRAVREGGKALSFENRYRCSDGSYKWFRWNATADLEKELIFSVARDITAAKEAEAERERLVTELQKALADVRTLKEILPICSYCRKVRDDSDYWSHVESYITEHTGSMFSHGICPDCMKTQVDPELRA